MKKSLPLIASAALVALALAGCSTGSISGSASTAPQQGSGGSTQNYTADDLVKILQTAEKTIGTGTISDNATVQANIAKAGNLKPSASLTADGGKIVPASCGTTLDNSIETDSKGFGVGSSGIAAELNYSKGIVAVFSATHGSLASGLANTLTTSLQQLFSACSTMQVTDGSASIAMTMTKVADHTDAAQTWALDEGVDVSGTTSTTTVIEALDGNIFITDTAIGGTNADAIAAVNAIVAAAKG
ncbi:MAG TPA: hypothetical protein VHZ98_01150 [Galbitalea sp.]|jgi:hypothetical protein|nr:hypothetical protein [Galbitalea sp.]